MARRQRRGQPPICDFCATTSGSKHESSHRSGIKAATTREVGAAAAQSALSGGNTRANRRNGEKIFTTEKKQNIQRKGAKEQSRKGESISQSGSVKVMQGNHVKNPRS
jgi:hypothetical protein